VDIAGISKDHANQPARHLGRYPSRHGEGSDSGGCGCGVLGGRHATRWSDSRDNPRVGRTKGRDVRGEKEEFCALQSNKRNDKVRDSARLKPMLAKPVLPCLALPAWQARPAPTIAVCPHCLVSTSCIRMRAVKINAKHMRHLARLISRHVLYSGCSVSTHSLAHSRPFSRDRGAERHGINIKGTAVHQGSTD
jgi:hypothetical protein